MTNRLKRDLDDIAGVMFSSPRRSRPTARSGPDGAPGATPVEETSAGAAPIDVLAVVPCGAADVGPLLALAIAALPSPWPHTRVFAIAADSQRWIEPIDSAPDVLEEGGGRAVVVAPPRDDRQTRALGFAASRHLVWVGPGGEPELQAYLDMLGDACVTSRVGCLVAADDGGPPGPAASWADRTGRTLVLLGTWSPGKPLPTAVCSFLGGAAPASGSIAWAWSLLK